jgi:hypothetical protein
MLEIGRLAQQFIRYKSLEVIKQLVLAMQMSNFSDINFSLHPILSRCSRSIFLLPLCVLYLLAMPYLTQAMTQQRRLPNGLST